MLANLRPIENIKNSFPVINHCVYANTAAFGLLSQELQEWRQEHDLDYLVGGGEMKMESLKLLAETKIKLGKFFGCEKEQIALVPNFSIGLNMLLEGLPARERVLLLENDYPSVNWPFESRGFHLTYLKISADLEAEILQEIRAKKISVFAFSMVQWLNGIRIDLDFIKMLKETFPELLIVADGTQFCGAWDFNFDSSGIDIMGASGYKWLLAGTGNGFMLLKDAIQERFSLKTTGFNSVGADLSKKNSIHFAKRLEPGHLDSLTFGSLLFSLDSLSGIGMDTITEHNHKLSEFAKKGFGELGLLEPAVLQRKAHSTIFNIKGDQPLFNYLSREEVVCSQRGGGIRMSFHYYNTEDDLSNIFQMLKSYRP